MGSNRRGGLSHLTGDRPVVYVDANGVGSLVDGAEYDEAVELVRAEDGVDAIKLLENTPAAAVLVPQDPPEMGLADLLARLADIAPATAVLVVGDGPAVPPGTRVIPEGASPEVARARLLDAIGDRRVDAALSRYDRLTADAFAAAEAAATADDRASVERAVHDRLMESEAVRFAWIGRHEDGSVEPSVGYPDLGPSTGESGTGDAGARGNEFVMDAVDTGEVTVQRGADRYRSGGASTTAGSDGWVVAAVPLAHGEVSYGVVVIGSDDPTAFDSSERALLGRMGRIVGRAIASTATQRGEADLDRIKEFVDFVSHEIRNPLAAASGYLEIARADDDPEALDGVARGLERIEGFVDSLVSMAEPGGIDEVVEVRLASAAAAAWEGVESPEAELEVENRSTVRADPVLLEHLLANLYRNAIQHGGPAVTVRVGALADGAGFFVEDDGPGIPEDDRERLFDLGFSTAEDGRGIGLNFVDRVADAHGWRIEVRESADGGARFEIRTGDAVESELGALFDAWESGGEDESAVHTSRV